MKKTKKRTSGILMPVSSLPSGYGIGSLGKEAYNFIDFLAEAGVGYWQVLPLNPTSYGDSPYQSPASLAGNPYFIDLEILSSEGLLTKDELKAAKHKSRGVDYGHLFETRFDLLRSAHARFVARGGDKTREYLAFLDEKANWIYDYSLFMALKVYYNHRPFTEWSEKHKNVSLARSEREHFSRDTAFFEWLQFEFYAEWQALLSYAHERGVGIIGDMPIYVAHDSMDVWQSPREFLLDEELNPVLVAGCPPDDFSPDGQLWGNPIYNWEAMELDGFGWWKSRILSLSSLYDVIRIDHFRGFSGYYNIPYGDTTAERGRWDGAPGQKLFASLKASFPDIKIIAEDLGYITDDVRALLKFTDFPGMKMLQFAFYNDDNEYLPRNYPTDNTVVYTGSHDNDTTRTWLRTLDREARARLKKECPRKAGESGTTALVRLALGSRANLAIIPISDYMELYGKEHRINTPSVSEGNWCWRIPPRYNTEKLRRHIRALLKEAKR